MAPLKCGHPGCSKTVDMGSVTIDRQLFKLHDVQVHNGTWDNQAACPAMDTMTISPGEEIVAARSVEDTVVTSSVKITMATAPVQDSSSSRHRGVKGIATRETSLDTQEA